MIESVDIQGFKCFRRLEVPAMTPITVVGGRNAVGKSALLECLFMFFDRASPNTTTGQYARRGVNSVPLTPDAVFAPVFRNYDLSQTLKVSVRLRGVVEEMTVAFSPAYRAATVSARPAATGNGDMLLPTDAPPKSAVALDISYSSTSGRDDKAHLVLRSDGLAIAVDRVTSDLPPAAMLAAGPADPNQVAMLYGNLDIAGKQDSVLDIAKVLEPRMRSLTSVPMGDGALMHADVGIGRKIPVAYVSEGLSRLLTIAVYMGNCSGGVVFVDEIENGIHHSVLANVWKALGRAAREFDCQIVATTHSYECLQAAADGLADEGRDGLSYIRLDRNDDEIVARTYDRTLLDAALSNGLELR